MQESLNSPVAGLSEPDAERLLAETRAFNAELERQLATLPSVHTLSPQQIREDRAVQERPQGFALRRDHPQ